MLSSGITKMSERGKLKHISMNATTISQKMAEVQDYINLAYIAEDYMEASPTWYYDRVKNNSFTQEDTEQLRSALLDLSQKLQAAAQSL